MTTLLLNTFLVLLTLLFGVMAYYPLFVKSTDTEQPVENYGEDIVIRIAPAPMTQKRPLSIAREERRSNRPAGDGSEHPGHRPAA